MSMLRKIQRVGKRATKFQYTATYQSVVVESLRDKWRPNKICVSWTRKGRRLITKLRPWQQSPDNNARGVVIWPEPEIMDITVTLYKGPKDKTYETKEWEFAVIDVDSNGKRKVLATTSINMVRYASSMPYDHDLHLRLKPTSRKIKTVMLEVSLTSKFLKEGKATDDDMISLASMMSVSNLSTIGFLEDEEDDYNYWGGGRSITPPMVPQEVLSTDQLLKWSQEVTADVPSVKITNMTTSWRSGLGFLAIIRYYRPDLVQDFEMLSPNTLKDNNILAFEIARSLGIACNLTPNMMVTATVPDKLAVMSFVYQMYQYFNRATQSAITRQNSRNVGSGANSPTGEESRKSPSSPFDITKFEVFASRDSPVTTAPPDANKVSMYSRHSRDNSQTEIQLQQKTTENVPRSISPILAQQAGLQVVAVEEHNHTNQPYSHQDQGTSNDVSTGTKDSTTDVHHSTSKAVSNDDVTGGEIDSHTVSPRTSAKLKLDELVSDHAYLIQPEEDGNITAEGEDASDRALEFENLKDTDESTSEPPTSSTVSLLDDDDARIPDLPLDDRPSTEHQNEPSQISPRRRLPSIPTEAPVSAEDLKREERRKRAKEMLKKHRIDALKIPSNLSSPSGPSTKNKYREEAINMLGKVFGTPETVRRVRVPRNEDDDLTSGDSATSFGAADEDRGGKRVITRPRSATASAGLQRSAKSDTNVKSSRVEVKKEITTAEIAPPAGRSRAKSFDSGSSKPQIQESGSDAAPQSTHSEGRPTSIDLNSNPAPSDKRRLEKRLSDSQLEAGRERKPRRTPTSPQGGQQVNVDIGRDKGRAKDSSRSGGGGRTTVSQATSPTSSKSGGGSTAGNRQKKRPAKALPTPRPVSAKPSAVLKNLVEQKKEEDDLEAMAAQRSQTDGAELARNEDTVETNHLQNGSVKGEQPSSSGSKTETAEANKQSPPKIEESPSKKKTLPSPAWSEHDDELSKDILVTQSEYVKGELIHLRKSLQDLEDRAGNIETDIRNAMSEGDREQEENLMQEWFGILNRKNELIKRQLELNFIEKEEDLEKRQFFINRELRPLMEIPEDDKTTAQKDREAQLLRELIELIDERDILERKRMSTERNAHHERYSLAAMQGETANNVQATTQQSSRQTSKDCVVQ